MSTCRAHVLLKVRRGKRPFHIEMRCCGQPAVVNDPGPLCSEHAHAFGHALAVAS